MAYIPEFYEDPMYRPSMQPRLQLGQDILAGKQTPFSAIGEYGGGAFDDMLAQIKKGIGTGVSEDLARRGVSRGGLGAAVTAEAYGNVLPGVMAQERQRSLSGLESLLGIGTNTLQGVGGQSLQFGEQKNSYNQMVAQILAAEEASKKANKMGMITGGISALGSLAGMGMMSSAYKQMAGSTPLKSGGTFGGGTSLGANSSAIKANPMASYLPFR